jgi:dTMP kinase
MIEGLFIVLEGIDGAGTTTHTRHLADGLRERGLPVQTTREPSDGPIGVQIRQVLTGRLVVPGMHGPRPPWWTTMALLFAADRMDHVESKIGPCLMDGVTVISDRYYHSSVAYQSITSGGQEGAADWVKELNRYARRPDLTIVLDVPDDVAAKRRSSRAASREMFDDLDLQRRLAAFYRSMPEHFPHEKIVIVNADRDVEHVRADVMAHVRRARGEG